MNIIFTIIAAPLIGWLVKSRTGAVAIYLAAVAQLFTFQTLAVLLGWMGSDTGLFESHAFGPPPTGFPIADTYLADLIAYGVVNLVIVLVGVGLTIGSGSLRVRRSAKRTAVAV